MGQILEFLRPADAFDPEVVEALGRAYDMALAALHDMGQPEVVREVLVRRIIRAAKKGERDVAKLCAIAHTHTIFHPELRSGSGLRWQRVGMALRENDHISIVITYPTHFTRQLSSAANIAMNTITFSKTAPPEWLLAMWKEIDDKTFGKGFDCFAEDAVCNLGVADWHGREAIRENLRRFIDKGLTAHHDVVEFWDSPLLKVFHGKVGMEFDDPNIKPVRPTMTHFFYMDEKAPTKVKHWIGAVGPTGF